MQHQRNAGSQIASPIYRVPEERYNGSLLQSLILIIDQFTQHSANATYWADLVRSYWPLLLRHEQYDINSQHGIPLTLHTDILRSYWPILYWMFCSSGWWTSSTPVSGWWLSPRLGFASWRSLNYFAVSRHLYSSSGGVLHSTEQDESFRFYCSIWL